MSRRAGGDLCEGTWIREQIERVLQCFQIDRAHQDGGGASVTSENHTLVLSLYLIDDLG
jgi:hypothetical protein